MTSTIKKTREFRLIYNRGRSAANKYLVLFVLKNRLDYNRLGISISKKIGKAVVRNKIRRRLKENFRQLEIEKQGYDFVFIARIPSSSAGYQELSCSMSHLIQKMK